MNSLTSASFARSGPQIPLLLRCSIAVPLVLTNTMLSLTSLSTWTYLWTTVIGEIVTSLPYAYATHIGTTLVHDKGHADPLMMLMSFVGLAASVAMMWKIGVVATTVLKERGGLDYQLTKVESCGSMHGMDWDGLGGASLPRLRRSHTRRNLAKPDAGGGGGEGMKAAQPAGGGRFELGVLQTQPACPLTRPCHPQLHHSTRSRPAGLARETLRTRRKQRAGCSATTWHLAVAWSWTARRPSSDHLSGRFSSSCSVLCAVPERGREHNRYNSVYNCRV